MTESHFAKASTSRARCRGIAVIVWLVLLVSVAARAQTASGPVPNNGALTVTAGLDAPSVYVFRGFVQETKPRITLFPYVDVGARLGSGDGFIKRIGVNVGLWNSLNTGNAGSDGPGYAHYEEDFYATLNLGFGGGVGVGIGYMALTSPNGVFDTTKELQVKVTKAHRLNPYGFLAMELTDASADGGNNKGTYLELGVGPSWPLGGGKFTFAVPVKAGLSVNDYYELTGEDQKFGWFDVGGLVTMPMTSVPARFGSWNVHGGVDVILMGERTKAANEDESSKVVALVGVGFTY